MNYHQYYSVDVVNGPGTRCTLFVAGCEHQCRGCYNQSTWSLSAGNPFTVAMADKIIADLQDPRIQRRGFSLSGGDPLHPANVGEITRLLQRIRAEAPDKDIWCWTGYELAALSAEQQQAVALMDVLVDGRFELAERDPTLLWRGSRNQQIHYLHQTTGTPHLG